MNEYDPVESIIISITKTKSKLNPASFGCCNFFIYDLFLPERRSLVPYSEPVQHAGKHGSVI
jgi:hypothetical protein